jgi:hypothetical protein
MIRLADIIFDDKHIMLGDNETVKSIYGDIINCIMPKNTTTVHSITNGSSKMIEVPALVMTTKEEEGGNRRWQCSLE